MLVREGKLLTDTLISTKRSPRKFYFAVQMNFWSKATGEECLLSKWENWQIQVLLGWEKIFCLIYLSLCISLCRKLTARQFFWFGLDLFWFFFSIKMASHATILKYLNEDTVVLQSKQNLCMANKKGQQRSGKICSKEICSALTIKIIQIVGVWKLVPPWTRKYQ